MFCFVLSCFCFWLFVFALETAFELRQSIVSFLSNVSDHMALPVYN